ncbi:MAG: tRNA (adenosine(37)-N6)-dimethylallyltransferase MiaA [bacterium]
MHAPDTPSQPPVILIVGPTASGKSSASLALAHLLGGEIVSADSRQVYRYMDIGTAKPLPSEREEVPHWGLDVVDPDERYSAGRYAEEARGWISEIRKRGRAVIVVGGSGLYLEALVEGFFSGADTKDDDLRMELEKRADQEGLDILYKELITLDPVYAEKTRKNDRQRILRALEVSLVAEEPFSSLHERKRSAAGFKTLWFGLEHNRKSLYERIDCRVGEMLNRGLVREVRGLLDRGYRDANALKSVGYKEVIDWYESRLPSLEEVREAIEKNTRRYAKRQLTWFRRYPQLSWLDGSASSESLAKDIQLEYESSF